MWLRGRDCCLDITVLQMSTKQQHQCVKANYFPRIISLGPLCKIIYCWPFVKQLLCNLKRRKERPHLDCSVLQFIYSLALFQVKARLSTAALDTQVRDHKHSNADRQSKGNMPRFETGIINSKGVDHLALFVDTSPHRFNQPAIENITLKLTFNCKINFFYPYEKSAGRPPTLIMDSIALLDLMILLERFFFGREAEGGEKINSAKNEFAVVESRPAPEQRAMKCSTCCQAAL